MARYLSIVVGLVWLASGITLAFNIGQIPVRAINRLRSGQRPIHEAAIVSVYWRFWGAVLMIAGVLLIWYTLR